MRQSFEMLEICGFWHEISNITRTRLEYIVTDTHLECFPPKIEPAAGNCVPYIRMGKTF